LNDSAQMVPVEHILSYSDIIGEKFAKKLGVDQIDLSHLSQKEIRTGIDKLFGMPMCLGIIANCDDWKVYHARNFDNKGYINPIM